MQQWLSSTWEWESVIIITFQCSVTDSKLVQLKSVGNISPIHLLKEDKTKKYQNTSVLSIEEQSQMMFKASIIECCVCVM